jgi:hypothetical protein
MRCLLVSAYTQEQVTCRRAATCSAVRRLSDVECESATSVVPEACGDAELTGTYDRQRADPAVRSAPIRGQHTQRVLMKPGNVSVTHRQHAAPGAPKNVLVNVPEG